MLIYRYYRTFITCHLSENTIVMIIFAGARLVFVCCKNACVLATRIYTSIYTSDTVGNNFLCIFFILVYICQNLTYVLKLLRVCIRFLHPLLYLFSLPLFFPRWPQVSVAPPSVA